MKMPGWYPYGDEGSRGRWNVASPWNLATLVLGLECWVLGALAPRLSHGFPSPSDLLIGSIPLIFLIFGTAWRGPSRTRGMLLLTGFPVALAAAVAARGDLTERDAWGPLTTGFLAISLFGFVALALIQVALPTDLRAASPQPLPLEAHRPLSDQQRNGRLVLALVLVAGTIGVAILPFWEGRAATLARFGEATDDAATLSVIVASLLFPIVVGAILGPGLRARKRTDLGRERRLARALPFLLLAAVAALARGLLFYLDQR